MKKARFTFEVLAAAVVSALPYAQTPLLGNAAQPLPERHEDAWGAAAADVDGDGDVDVVLAQDGFDRLLLHRAGGVFVESAGGLPAHESASVDAALIDVDGDGDADLVVANFEDQNRLYLNDGGGIFVDASVGLPVDANRSVDLSAGDVDGDGDVDVLVGNSSDQQNRLYRNAGGGSFSDATDQLPLDTDRTVELVLADLDGDGDLDALAANDLANRKYRNEGGGLFVDASGDLPVEADESYGLDVGDVDGDGDLDALIGNLGGPNRLHRNDGAGTFVDDPAGLPAVVSSTYVVRFFDVDCDADLDLFLGNQGSDELYENDGAGLFADVSERLPDAAYYTRASVCADWDGDGDLDLLVGTVSEEEDALYRNSRGRFMDWSHGDQLPAGSSLRALGDVDGDGDLDGVGLDGVAYRNDGSGRFVPDIGALPDGAGFDPALGDVDDDGALDVLFGRDADGQARLFLGDGAGTFSDASDQLPVSAEYLGPVALGDLDGDGALDAYLGNAPGHHSPDTGQDRVYLNDGSGFSEGGELPVESIPNYGTRLADLDGDGDLDVLLVAGQWGKRMWRNDGAAAFADASSELPVMTNNTICLAVGDVDADGDVDAFFGVFGFNELYLNDGSGAFADAADTHLPAFGPALLAPRSAALGDLDEDGDPDLMVQAGSSALLLRALANDGSGAFTLLDDAIVECGHHFPELLADVDGDGDLDVPLRGHVLFGWRRQVTAVGPAVPGRDLLFDLRGPPGTPWYLAYSTGGARLDLPPFGTLLVDPDGLVELGGGLLDMEGSGELGVPVVHAPVLQSTQLFVQGLVGAPPRLTNLEVVTLR